MTRRRFRMTLTLHHRRRTPARRVEPELMDDPRLDPRTHARALRGLARLNRLSRPDSALWPDLDRACRASTGPVRLLDLATGSGDLPLRLLRRARRRGRSLHVDGCDLSPLAIKTAQARSRRCGHDACFFRHDVITQQLPDGYDVITCCLFLHHLSQEQAIGLLCEMKRAARRLVLVSDLRRCRTGPAVIGATSRLLTRSHVVHTDAVRSARAAFTMEEAASMAARAGMDDATIRKGGPYRFVLSWWRKTS
ncbi:MAG: methyltransferase domain-containing protein [Planctomycetes bacterium]|nr:methyltransferase domain-containing protein [Planctomycetota bacterium]